MLGTKNARHSAIAIERQEAFGVVKRYTFNVQEFFNLKILMYCSMASHWYSVIKKRNKAQF